MKPIIKKIVVDALSAFAFAAVLSFAMYGCMKSENEWLIEQDKRRAEQYIAAADRVIIEIKERGDE